MTHRRQELVLDPVHAFHLPASYLGGLARELLPDECLLVFFRRALGGEVAGHLGKPRDLALLVAKGGDDDVGPEAGAVLANAPALVLESTLASHGVEDVIRLAGGAIFARIEHREVLAEDFV